MKRDIICSITGKGRVTIPAEVRPRLGVSVNDKVSFMLESAGTIRLAAPRYSTVGFLRGAAGSLKRAMPFEGMRGVAWEDRMGAKRESLRE